MWSDDEGTAVPSCSWEIRACADASDSPGGCCFNLAWSPAERIACSDSEVILAQMVASQLAFGEPPVGSKDDLRKAYHQVGRCLTPVRVVQLFWDPQRREVVGRELLSQDFGTGGAVTNSNVVFWCLRDVLSRWFFINVDNYFDDFWTWEPPWSASSARFVLREVLKVLEYDVKEAKSQHGTQLPLLGLVPPARRAPKSATAVAGASRWRRSAKSWLAPARWPVQRRLA